MANAAGGAPFHNHTCKQAHTVIFFSCNPRSLMNPQLLLRNSSMTWLSQSKTQRPLIDLRTPFFLEDDANQLTKDRISTLVDQISAIDCSHLSIGIRAGEMGGLAA